MRPKIHKCDFENCTKAYNRQSLLAQHKRSHTGERPFKCDQCPKSFLRKYHLQSHLLSHLPKDTLPFTCQVCGKGTISRQNLRTHEASHNKSYKCPEEGCGEVFDHCLTLRHHRNLVHLQAYTCKECDKIFPSRGKLALHVLRMHGIASSVQCDHPGCFESFTSAVPLKHHIKTVHPRLKCPVCGEEHIGGTDLAIHMAVHDEGVMVSLFNCQNCSGKFVRKTDLVRHYHECHDGQMPPDLLSESEKDALTSILKDGNYEAVPSDEEDEEVSDTPSPAKSVPVDAAVSLLSANHMSKTLACPRANCKQKFRRPHDVLRHLRWHEIKLDKINKFLKSLDDTNENKTIVYSDVVEQQKEREVGVKFEDLIDSELKALSQQH